MSDDCRYAFALRFRVRAARFADARRDAAGRARAADLAWRDSAAGDAADRPSLFSFRSMARERLGDGFV